MSNQFIYNSIQCHTSLPMYPMSYCFIYLSSISVYLHTIYSIIFIYLCLLKQCICVSLLFRAWLGVMESWAWPTVNNTTAELWAHFSSSTSSIALLPLCILAALSSVASYRMLIIAPWFSIGHRDLVTSWWLVHLISNSHLREGHHGFVTHNNGEKIVQWDLRNVWHMSLPALHGPLLSVADGIQFAKRKNNKTAIGHTNWLSDTY